MSELFAILDRVEAAAASLPATVEHVSGLSDDELIGFQRRLAAIGRRVDASAALGAGEIARRSRPDLGYAGLAQRTGARTPDSLIQQLTGSTGREASELVRVGKVMHEAQALTPAPVGPDGGADHDAGEPGDAGSVDGAPESGQAGRSAESSEWDGTGFPWLTAVARAVADGRVALAAADAIRAGLGTPTEGVPVQALTRAAEQLLEQASTVHADRLLKLARTARDDLDFDGIAAREQQNRDRRYLRLYRLADGMTKIDGLLDPESAELVQDAFNTVTSPRRGGPRFVDPTQKTRATRLLEDPRTTEQIMADTLVDIVRLATETDPGHIFGHRRPAVRILVTARDLTTGHGIGRLETHGDPVSIQTVQRQTCDTGTIPIQFDDNGQCLNLGREHRLFTQKQRIALAARDGGCRYPQCDRPPSWCEAHHTNQWHQDTGNTNINDGILLCRHHHMLIHNNHWQIQHHHGTYQLIPPREQDPTQTPIQMPTKSTALHDLYTRAATQTG